MPPPPPPRFLNALAWVLISCTVLLLILGGLTTSKKAGMADPVWPTEPWFVLVNGEKIDFSHNIGFALEHTHRFAGWAVGLVAMVLAFAAWNVGPNARSRIGAMIALFLLLAAYGWFHGAMSVAQKELTTSGQFAWPWPSIAASGGCLVLLAFFVVHHLLSDRPWKWLRAWITLVLLAVMVQGLLGGLRVLLDNQAGLKSTIGVEFSQLHGLFAQLVFSAMVLIPFAMQKPDAESPQELRRPALLLPIAIFIQLIWAVWVRHAPTPLMERLHFITAFFVAGCIVWLAVRLLSANRYRFAASLLLGMLLLQIALGVEAWMGKFAATVPDSHLPPSERKITDSAVLIRTAHQLIGAGLLAISVSLAWRIRSSKPALETRSASEVN